MIRKQNGVKKTFVRVFASALAVLMLLTSGAYAETINEFADRFTVPQQYELDVPTDIEVKKVADTTYVDGPIVVKKTSGEEYPVFDFKAMLDMTPVRNLFTKLMAGARTLIAGDTQLLTELDALPVRGRFTVTIKYPSLLTLPDAIQAGDLFGFNTEASNIFKEVSREIETSTNWSKLVITIEVKSLDGTKDFVTAKELEDNLTSYLCDLSLTCENVNPQSYATYRIYGSIEGVTTLGADAEGNNPITTVKYSAKQMEGAHNADGELSATVSVIKSGGGSSSGGIGGTTPGTGGDVNIAFDVGGVTDKIDPISSSTGKATVNVDELPIPQKEDSKFVGWYADKEMTIPITGEVTVTKDTVFYAKFENTTVPSVLTQEHYAYVIGYPEGDVRAENTITREEVASIFYRLLTQERRDEIMTDKNDFSDVNADRWSNKAISSMTAGGYIAGYDGAFRPADAITRAEFATIISKFSDAKEEKSFNFPDIAGHWAESYIVKATRMGVINGYDDGTFRPDNKITRAEAMAMLNRILVRKVDAEGILPDAKKWNDISTDDWYYYDVMEATNSHEFDRRDDGLLEKWTKLFSTEVADVPAK